MADFYTETAKGREQEIRFCLMIFNVIHLLLLKVLVCLYFLKEFCTHR